MAEYDFHPAFKSELKSSSKRFADIFPDKEINAIAKAIHIQEGQIIGFREFLFFACSHYLANRISPAGINKNIKSIEHFEKIARQAKKLVESIGALEMPMQQLFWSHLSEIAAAGIRSKSNSNIPPLYFVTRMERELNGKIFSINDQRVLEVVEYLGKFAEWSREKISEEKGGRPKNVALYLLVASCRLYLTNLAAERKVPKARAPGLLVQLRDLSEVIIERLDPTIQEGAITTAIRATSKSPSLRKGKNPGKEFPK